MTTVLSETVYWGVLISLGSYYVGRYLQKKYKLIIFNPLLFSTVVTILVLVICHIDYEVYFEKSNYLNYLLTPTTVSLAVPLYEQVRLLKENLIAILLGILSGIFAGLCCILFFSALFHFPHEIYVTILPKSITAAMAMSVSEELGGISSLTVPIVIMTGITGHIIAELVCKVFRITDPIAKGVAIGSSSHAMGTAKALEIGEIEGAMSSLSMAVAGVLTVIGTSLFSYLY